MAKIDAHTDDWCIAYRAKLIGGREVDVVHLASDEAVDELFQTESDGRCCIDHWAEEIGKGGATDKHRAWLDKHAKPGNLIMGILPGNHKAQRIVRTVTDMTTEVRVAPKPSALKASSLEAPVTEAIRKG